MFLSHFRESSSTQPVALGDLSEKIFRVIAEYLYTNQLPSLSFDMVEEVFLAGDMFLLPGLRTEATNWLISQKMISLENVLEALSLAQHFSATKLEQQCCEIIALNLEECVQQPEFTDFVAESIQSIKNRQETDSVPLIDDIRYEILRFHGNQGPDQDPTSARSTAARARRQKLALLDTVIETLGVKRTPYREQ